MPAPDNLSDLGDFPDLSMLLAQYVGALALQALGHVDADYVERKLRQLRTSCRAANAIIKRIGKPELDRRRTMLAPGAN